MISWNSPVLGHADHAVLLRDDDRGAHHILESLDLAEQTRPPSLRLGLDFGRHGSVEVLEVEMEEVTVVMVVLKPPSTLLLASGNITPSLGPTGERGARLTEACCCDGCQRRCRSADNTRVLSPPTADDFRSTK